MRRVEIHPLNPQPRLLQQAAMLIGAGGVALLPTAAGYLPACLLDDKAATARLQRLAGVAERDAPVLLCRDLSQAALYLRIDDGDFRALRSQEPGSAALSLACTKRVPRRLSAAGRANARLFFAGHIATHSLMALLDLPLLLAPASWGAGPDNVDDLPPAWRHNIDLALDAGPVQAIDAFSLDVGADMAADATRREPAASALA